MRLLILGGTAEARELAAQLHGREHLQVVSSLAGRLADPQLPEGEVRIGGFRDSGGLSEYLQANQVDVVIDATHPFASTISANAVEASKRVGCRLIRLDRPGWMETEGDDWRRVPDLAAAAATVAAAPPGVVFLTTGRRDLAAFAGDANHQYLVRAVEKPTGGLPPRTSILLARGPFTLEAELSLMRDHRVTLLVSKDTGGSMTGSKLGAARMQGIPVVLVDRPPPPSAFADVVTVATADEALSRLQVAL